MTYLIIRYRSLGNVAMLVPILASMSTHHPTDRFVLLSSEQERPLFESYSNIDFIAIDKSGNLKSTRELLHELAPRQIDQVIDLQANLRSYILSWALRRRGVLIVRIEYGRWTKWRMLFFNQIIRFLPTEQERYIQTFAKAGIQAPIDFETLPVNEAAKTKVEQLYGTKQGAWYGLAPFAKYKSNILPLRESKNLVMALTSEPNARLFLFGAGKVECEILRQWAAVFPHTVCVAGHLPLEQEMELMRQLDTMVCMDSANQHLASLVGLRAVSVWMATHPAFGFYGWKQDPQDAISVPNLRCRPCSIHGKSYCRYGNFACQNIQASKIMNIVHHHYA